MAFLLTQSDFWHFWVHEKFAIVTRLVDYPQYRVCEIVLLGGEDLKAWEHYEELLCSWAKTKHCKEAEMLGREGWDRIKHPGWAKTGVRLTKEL